jgi:hypothetical protein
MVSFIEYLKLPATVGGVIVACFLVMQIIGGILDFKGKTVPVIMNIRKHFKHKKQERIEMVKTLKAVQALLNDVNQHYEWMKWVNDRAKTYDAFIKDMGEKFADVVRALNDNTGITEEMFIQNSRDRIIDFATKVENKNTMVSREEFNRIFKVYDKYENFLKERGLTNGEVDINYQIIKESYEEHLRNHTFIEDVRSFTK